MKKLVLFLALILLFFVGCYGWIYYNINLNKQSFKEEAENYLEKKYFEKMMVTDNIVIGDEKSVQAYPIETPEIIFFVRKGDVIGDTYLYAALRHQAELILKDAFSQYDSEIFVSELKWCNPTPNRQFETLQYLDELYKKLGHIPLWKDVNEYQKVEYANVDIKTPINNENEIFKVIQNVEETGCHIENLQIKDSTGRIYKYTV